MEVERSLLSIYRGFNCVLQKDMTKVLTPSGCKCDLILIQGLCRYQLKMMSYWIRVGPNPMTHVLIRSVHHIGTEIQGLTHGGKKVV